MRLNIATGNDMRAFIVALSTLACNWVFAAPADSSTSLQLYGSGTLKPDPIAQSNGNFVLRATLQPKDVLLGANPPAHESRFGLRASLTEAAQVCYNDTIFRDDFDGDGS